MAKLSFLKDAPIHKESGGRKLSFSLLILFSFFILAGVMHHHPDGFCHQGCFLCYLSLQHSDYILQIPVSTSLIAGPFFSFSPDNLPVFSSLGKGPLAIRAPPV